VTYSSVLLSRPGAVPAEGPDAGVAAHYGDPMREQRSLSRGEATVDLSHRGVVTVTGPDRLTWLHSFTSQHMSSLTAGEPTHALILSPQGHIEHDLRVRDDGTTTWLTTEPGQASPLVDFLDSMRFMSRVEVEDVTESWAVRWREPTGEEIVRRADLAQAAGDGVWAGTWAYEALRIARGEPRLGLDTDHRTLPNEVGLLDRAVHMDKGCYRGQETVARVFNLGRVPRRLTRLHLDGSTDLLPDHGDGVVEPDTPDRVIGTIGSAARHHEDGPIALALLKRGVDVQAPLEVRTALGTVAAAQEVVVHPDTGLHVRPRL
jgi:folate-binding protein YgfZ